jgi:F0F1-type ATP synthase beta subunit
MSNYRKEANIVAKETYWTVWKVLPILLIILIIGFSLNSAGLIGSKMVERQVLVNSHQYIEGMQQRAGILKANIAELDVMISLGKGNKTELLGQKRVLKAQLLAITK